MFHVVNTRAPSFLNLAGNKDNHDISDEFEIRPDRTEELSALERLEISHRLIMEKCCQHSSAFIFRLDHLHSSKKRGHA